MNNILSNQYGCSMPSAAGLAFPKLLWAFAVIARVDPGTMMLVVFK
jgi:hypothetical protein